MATYNITAEQNSESPKPGTFWLKGVVDFNKHNAAQNDVFNVFKLRQGWIVMDSFYKILVGSSLGSDWEIGWSGATTDVADVSTTTTAGEWTAGSETRATAYSITADKYLQVVVGDADESIGKLGIMLEVFAGWDENEPADMDIS
jgi:hypothetical protein